MLQPGWQGPDVLQRGNCSRLARGPLMKTIPVWVVLLLLPLLMRLYVFVLLSCSCYCTDVVVLNAVVAVVCCCSGMG